MMYLLALKWEVWLRLVEFDWIPDWIINAFDLTDEELEALDQRESP